VKEVTINLNKYEIGLATGKLYDFVWSDFCDWYIEATKPMLYGDNERAKLNALTVLNFVLDEILKLMHPFIPFVTEEIYQYKQTGKCHALMMQEWPKYNKKFNYYKEAKAFEGVMDIIKAIRNVRNAGCAVEENQSVRQSGRTRGGRRKTFNLYRKDGGRRRSRDDR
jgi:valyl-tRNA synthetase